MDKRELGLFRNRSEIKNFEELIRNYKLSKRITKKELKKTAILDGMSVATFHNHFFVLEAFGLIVFDNGSKEWVFNDEFYKVVMDA